MASDRNHRRWASSRVLSAPMNSPMHELRRLIELPAREDGQTMSEYATVLSVITLAGLAAFALLAASVTGAYARVAGFFS